MENQMYNELKEKILENVYELNENRTLLDYLKRKEYHASVPLLDEFNTDGEYIRITYNTNAIKKIHGARPLLASIGKGENGGLDGVIYAHEKKVEEPLKKIVHSFAHKYNIPTGDLL